MSGGRENGRYVRELEDVKEARVVDASDARVIVRDAFVVA